ncbi:MAG: hypothetical protein ACR2NU_16360 [Aeoliella sp.]
MSTLSNSIRTVLLTFAMVVPIAIASSVRAATLTWNGAGDGISFAQLSNWTGTPTGGTIIIGDLVDTYVVDSAATITNVSGNLRFRNGGGLVLSAGSLDLLASGTSGLGVLESPDSLGTIDLTGGTVTAQFLAELSVSIGGDASLPLGGGNVPINESTIDFTGAGAQLHLLNETTSAFTSEHLNKVSVFGSPAVIGSNLQVVSDGGAGSIVTPLGSFNSTVELLVDRDTGSLTLSNATGQPVEFLEYDIFSTAGGLNEAAWTSIATNYDAPTNGGNSSVDPDDAWLRFTGIGSRTDLAEGSLGEATLAHNQTIDLGNAWIASPLEDLVATLALTDGSDLVVDVLYSGTAIADPIELGDFNADGTIDADDWPSLRGNLFTDVSGMLAVDAHAAGDMNGSGTVDELDFKLFKTAFEATSGAGAFAAMTSQIPEPTTLVLSAIGLMMAGCRPFVIGSRKA